LPIAASLLQSLSYRSELAFVLGVPALSLLVAATYFLFVVYMGD